MSVCLRVMGGCWWQGELSHSTLRVRETHRDGWPLQLCWERVLTRSLLVKAVVWVGPYCWLRGYDLWNSTQRKHPEIEGYMSLSEGLANGDVALAEGPCIQQRVTTAPA